MTREEYAAKLRDPRWQKKRLLIMERDRWTCQRCGDKETTLTVHHRWYTPDSDPWDYPDACLVTLCEKCHKAEGDFWPECIERISEALKRIGMGVDNLADVAYGLERANLEYEDAHGVFDLVASLVVVCISTSGREHAINQQLSVNPWFYTKLMREHERIARRRDDGPTT